MMPKNLILVRHGESESNIAVKQAKKGDWSAVEKLFDAKHDSLVRLTEKGIAQAKLSGEWLRENFPASISGGAFGRCYVSEYVRAMETAGHLGIEGAEWFVDSNLRERSRGLMNYFKNQEVEESVILKKFTTLSATEPYYWVPIGGESMAELCLRLRVVLDTLHRECGDQDVVIVCHGEVIWGFRILLERLSQEEYKRLDASKDPNDRIYNGQIIHYTRVDPFMDHQVKSSYKWMRSVCPTMMEKVSGAWRNIVRKKFTNAELLARVSVIPPVL